MKKVSIIITTHNGLDSIYDCVRSAINQDYPNKEIIVVDDNGLNSDNQQNTYKKIKCFEINNQIKYIAHEKNQNGSAARNTGIKNSTGEYLAFLDDDDILHKDSISKRLFLLDSKPENYGLCLCSFDQYRSGFRKEKVLIQANGYILYDFLMGKYQSPSSCILIRKNILKQIGLWDESFFRHQDWEFITRIVSKYKVCSCEKSTVDRRYIGRHCAKDGKKYEINRMHFLKKMKPYIMLLSKEQQDSVYFVHSYDVFKNYVKNAEFMSALFFLIKIRHPLRMCVLLIQSSLS